MSGSCRSATASTCWPQGSRRPVGIKVAGPDLDVIAEIGQQIEDVIGDVPGTASVYAERVTGGRFIDIDVNRQEAARFGLNIADVHDLSAPRSVA